MSQRPDFEEHNESQTEKLKRKVLENPFMPIGILGLISACAYGAYQYRNRGKMSTSLYLIQLRVGAQSAVVGALTIGVAYTLIKEYLIKKDN